MENTGLVSVIIPVYNVRPYLEEALDSVLAQSYQNLEALVIDDGSTDGSGEICDRYAERDGRFRVIHQENRGLGAARNAGLDRMSGEMVAFLDPDDAYDPSFVEEMVTAMAREKVDVVICRYTVHFSVGKLESQGRRKTSPSIVEGSYDRAGALSALVEGAVNNSVWNKLYRRKLWQDTRFVEGHAFEDAAVTYRMLCQSQRVYALEKPLYRYRRRPGSITATVSGSNLADRYLTASQLLAFVQSNTPEFFTPRQLRRVRLNQLSTLMRFYTCYRGEIGKDAFGEEARRKIIAMGAEAGVEDAGFKIRMLYCMLRFCPWLLRLLYPVYHSLRQGVRKLTLGEV